ncbi:cupin [Litoreibacter janthinus]|uniref:cupin n=1 Tax=Litoreibacter janthinus TaxID=670154 RepID=UPI001FEA606F|nr:cupin [Litoreibacter janthinus]
MTEWRFKKRGDNTGWHRHEHDYVVVPLFDGTLEIKLPEGEVITAPMQNGVPYFRKLGIEHDVLSANDFECAFIEIELLESPSDGT